MDIWKRIEPNFNKKENWGDWRKLSGFLLLVMNELRIFTGVPIIIHNAYETEGHSPTGQHPHGNACDFHFYTMASFREQIATVEDFLDKYQIAHVVGLGIYPYWKNLTTGEELKGFHLDTRNDYARWAKDIDGSYISYPAMLHRINLYSEGD